MIHKNIFPTNRIVEDKTSITPTINNRPNPRIRCHDVFTRVNPVMMNIKHKSHMSINSKSKVKFIYRQRSKSSLNNSSALDSIHTNSTATTAPTTVRITKPSKLNIVSVYYCIKDFTSTNNSKLAPNTVAQTDPTNWLSNCRVFVECHSAFGLIV